MRVARPLLILVTLCAAALAATTTALEPLAAAVEARLAALDPQTPRERHDERVLGVNQSDQAQYNDLAVAGKTVPWLQDADETAWGAWAVEWRDVVVLDEENRKVAVF